jgi:hypothetical protein
MVLGRKVGVHTLQILSSAGIGVPLLGAAALGEVVWVDCHSVENGGVAAGVQYQPLLRVRYYNHAGLVGAGDVFGGHGVCGEAGGAEKEAEG